MTTDTDLEDRLRAGPPGADDAPARPVDLAADAELAYARVESPLGQLVAVVSERGLVRLAYERENGGVDAVLDRLAARLSPRIVEAPRRLDAVRAELDEFFTGARREFDLAVDLALVTGPFARRLLEATSAIPFGATLTYRDVAERAGNERAVRAAGNALGANPVPIVVPCHRVLRTGGGLGGYTGGLDKKERLLALEAGRGDGPAG